MMRGRLTALLCYFATLATMVAIGAGWAAAHMQSESGFTELASQVGDDPKVQAVSADLTGEAFADQANLPLVSNETVAQAVSRAILRLTENDDWSSAWRETVRRSHERLFTDPPPTDIRVDVAPLVDLALDEVTTRLPGTITGPKELLITVSEEDPAQLVAAVSHARTVAIFTASVAALAALLGLLFARRRADALMGLGFGALAAAGAWWALAHLVLPKVIENRASVTEYGRELHQVVTDHIVASFDATLLWVALAGAGLLVVGLVGRALRS